MDALENKENNIADEVEEAQYNESNEEPGFISKKYSSDKNGKDSEGNTESKLINNDKNFALNKTNTIGNNR